MKRVFIIGILSLIWTTGFSQNVQNNSLIAVESYGKWGYIDTQGTAIVSCQFDDVEPFFNGVAKVKKDGKYGIINSNGNIIVTCLYDWISYSDRSETTNLPDGFAKVKQNQKYGLINTSGDIVIPCQYDDDFLFMSNGLIRVSQDRKYGIISQRGEIVVPCRYQSIGDYSNDMAVIRDSDHTGFINSRGEEVVPCKYAFAGSFSEGLAAIVNDEGKIGFINLQGNVVIPCKYDRAWDFSDGLAPVSNGNGFGYINHNDELLIPYGFMEPSLFSNGCAIVRRISDGKCGIIDTSGKTIIPFEYGSIEPVYTDGTFNFSNGGDEFCMIRTNLLIANKGNTYGIFNEKGETIIPFVEEPITLSNLAYFDKGAQKEESEILVHLDRIDKSYLISSSGKLIIPFAFKRAYPSFDGYRLVLSKDEDDDDFGPDDIILIKDYSNMVNNSKKDYVFFGPPVDGYTIVVSPDDGKTGFADLNGEVKVPLKYDRVGVFWDGLAPVMNDSGLWGYIDKEGLLVIPCAFDDVGIFYKGLALVGKDNKFGLINTKGEFIVPLGKYDNIRYKNEPIENARITEYPWYNFL